jgi:hypothetical protein
MLPSPTPRESPVGQRDTVNPVTEHALFLILFITTAGGW